MKLLCRYFLAVYILVWATRMAYAQEALTWDDCVKEAAKNHPDLISATEAVKASEAARRITASSQYPRADGRVSGSVAKSTGSDTEDTYSTSLTGSQLVFDGKKPSMTLRRRRKKLLRQNRIFAMFQVMCAGLCARHS